MHLQNWQPFVYGGICSAVAECGTFPIDTTKTRLQIQGQVNDVRHRQLRYRGMLHALVRISKEEGLRALYSGIGPAILRQTTYGTVKIGIYYSLKNALMRDPHDETLVKNMICGIFAGVVSSSLANPTDVLKVRMQAHHQYYKEKGMFQCFLDMYNSEGIRGLWRGVGPTAQRAAVVVGVELPVYDITKKNLILSTSLDDNVYTHFISSFIAGMSGAIASTPIDVIRTRLMNQQCLKVAVTNGSKAEVIYTSSFQCAVQTIQTEGFFALYKGFVPTWFRLGPWNIIFFLAYEQLKRIY